MVVLVIMYGYESWTIKKAESRRIDAFELWCWRRLLRVPWTTRRSNQSILKEISPEYSLEGLMLKLKLEYFGHLMWRTDSLEKTLLLGKIEGGGEGDDRGWDWIASPTQWTWVWASSRRWWRTGKPGVLQSIGSQRVGHDWATEQQWEFLEIRKLCPRCSFRGTEERGIWFLASDNWSLASWERTVVAAGKDKRDGSTGAGRPFPGQLVVLNIFCDNLSRSLAWPAPGHHRRGVSPVGRRPGDPAARRRHQHGVPLLRQPHPLLHQPGFPLHVILRLLCGQNRGMSTKGEERRFLNLNRFALGGIQEWLNHPWCPPPQKKGSEALKFKPEQLMGARTPD